jgi:hypothetical protein
VEELIPTLQQFLLVLLNYLAKPIDFLAAETTAALQPHGIEPKLRFTLVPLDMDVRRLGPIAGVEKEPERALAKHCRHRLMLYQLLALSNIFGAATPVNRL